MENTKGKYLGKCNMSSCNTNEPATWYNQGSYAYYCTSCANRLNNDPFNKRDAERLFRSPLCIQKSDGHVL